MNPMDPSNPHRPWIPIGSQSSLLGAESESDDRSEEEISEGVDRPLEEEHEWDEKEWETERKGENGWISISFLR